MEMVGRRVVDHVDVRIGDELSPAPVSAVDAVLFRFALSRGQSGSSNRDHIDITKTADSLNMLRRDKARPYQTHTDTPSSDHRLPLELSLRKRNIDDPCSTQLISLPANRAACSATSAPIPFSSKTLP